MQAADIPQHISPAAIQQIIEICYNQQEASLALVWKAGIWQDVIGSRNWGSIRRLILRDCQLGAGNVHVIADRQWPNLQTLQLTSNKLQPSSITTLTTTTYPSLKFLKLDNNFLQNEGFDTLISSPLITQLQQLCIDRNNVGSEGLRNIGGRAMGNLGVLALSIFVGQVDYNRIGSAGVKFLVKADLPNLTKLQLYKCQIQSSGLCHLTKSNWPHLKHLNINDNNILSQGHSLAHPNNWKKLSYISIWEPNPIHVLAFVGNVWGKGLAINKEVYQQEFRKSTNKVLKARFMK